MNNGSCYVQLAGCGVRETSHVWFSIVHPVSKLPEKRIISGNDHWHCPTLLMAISQYLTSHHLCQSYKQRVMCGARTVSSVCCTFYHRTQQWARNCDLNAWQACEMSCWTGCWVMWFYEACRDLPASQPPVVMPSQFLLVLPFIFYPWLLSHRAGDALRCMWTALQGHVGLQLVGAKKSWVWVCPWKRVIP